MTTDRTPSPATRSLFVYALLYGGMTVLAGILGNKQVALGPLAVESGIFAFLLLVALSSAVTELHGAHRGRQLVMIGFVPLLLAMALIGVVLALPPSPEMDPGRLTAFETILGQSPRIMAGGIIAYGVSQILNVTLFSKLRGKAPDGVPEGNGEGGTVWLAARGAIASAFSQVIDTLIFISVAFYGEFPIGQLLAGQMLAKVVLSLTLIPLLITGLVRWGRALDARPF